MNHRRLVAGIVLLLTALAPLSAHHSLTAEYDPKAPIAIRGRLARVEWTNPHSFLYVEMTTGDGPIETWKVEAAAPSALARAGLAREMLVIDTTVDISGLRAKNGSRQAWGRFITFADGAKHPLFTTQESDPASSNVSPASTPADRGTAQPPYLLMIVALAVVAAGLYAFGRRGTPGS
jgi:hypothetical protein